MPIIQLAMLAIIVIAFLASVKNALFELLGDLGDAALIVVDAPGRLLYLGLLVVAGLIGAAIAGRGQVSWKIKAGSGLAVLILLVCVSFGARPLTNAWISVRTDGAYEYCRSIVVDVSMKSTRTYYVYARLPEACDALPGMQETVNWKKDMRAIIDDVNGRFP